MNGSSPLKTWRYHAISVWLFTLSDLKTIVLPSTAFGIVNYLAILNLPCASEGHKVPPTSIRILLRAPLVAFWAWINLLPFTIDNQRQPEAIEEDSSNKPWRTMPSGRLQPESARKLMLLFYLLAIAASVQLGPLPQCLTLILLGYWYNDRQGADRSCIVRNFINASGFVCYTSGALQVAAFGEFQVVQDLMLWFLIIAAAVFSTVHSQDLHDQPGDSLRQRKTMPLVVGDLPARWTIAIPTIIWSWICPWFWSVSLEGYIGPLFLGHLVAARTLSKRSVSSDKNTFRLWNLWLVSLYCLPLVFTFGSLSNKISHRIAANMFE